MPLPRRYTACRYFDIFSPREAMLDAAVRFLFMFYFLARCAYVTR